MRHVLRLEKDGHRYIIGYHSGLESNVKEHIRDMVNNQYLNFDESSFIALSEQINKYVYSDKKIKRAVSTSKMKIYTLSGILMGIGLYFIISK